MKLQTCANALVINTTFLWVWDWMVGLKKFLHPGPGYGGSCFPKDTLALVKTAQDHEAPVRIVEAVVDINDQRKRKWQAGSLPPVIVLSASRLQCWTYVQAEYG